MIRPGLCSVTFRKLSAESVIRLVERSEIRAIEWGADVHAPPTQIPKIKRLAELCRSAGIDTPSYGSYFRVGTGMNSSEFELLLDAAQTLEAKTIRVWAGSRSSSDLSDLDWQKLIEQSLDLAERATKVDLRIGFEYHLRTATDSNDAIRRLLDGVNHPAVDLYWQPRQGLSFEERKASLSEIESRLGDLHVFHWVGENDARRPLAEGAAEWKEYLALANMGSRLRFAHLEFIADNSEAVFLRDASTLCTLLGHD